MSAESVAAISGARDPRPPDAWLAGDHYQPAAAFARAVKRFARPFDLLHPADEDVARCHGRNDGAAGYRQRPLEWDWSSVGADGSTVRQRSGCQRQCGSGLARPLFRRLRPTLPMSGLLGLSARLIDAALNAATRNNARMIARTAGQARAAHTSAISALALAGDIGDLPDRRAVRTGYRLIASLVAAALAAGEGQRPRPGSHGGGEAGTGAA